MSFKRERKSRMWSPGYKPRIAFRERLSRAALRHRSADAKGAAALHSGTIVSREEQQDPWQLATAQIRRHWEKIRFLLEASSRSANASSSFPLFICGKFCVAFQAVQGTLFFIHPRRAIG